METNNLYTAEDFLNKMDETLTVSFHKFELSTSSFGKEHLYCFVEGHDLPFYSIRIEAISGITCHCFNSGGKKNVITVNDMIRQKPEYSKYKILYMVDCDYDDNSNIHSSIYVTPCYSVENLYNVNYIIEKQFGLSPGDSNYNTIKSFIDEKREEFINAISTFCAWYYCVKKKERETSIIYKINLKDNIDPRYLEYNVDNTGISITSHYTLTQLNSDFRTNISQDELLTGLTYINHDLNHIRGKYLFQFIEKLLSYFNSDSSINGPHRFIKSPLGINVDRKKLMTTINVIAITPKCLIEYVNKFVV